MSRRATFLIDDDLAEKIYQLQSQMQATSDSSISFSRVVNDVIREALKNRREL